MRFYQERYPEVDELVMVQVRQIAEMGAYVKLVGNLLHIFYSTSGFEHLAQLEYDNIEGMILLSELSRRRIRSIQKLIRVGRNEVVVVLRVDKEKGVVHWTWIGLFDIKNSAPIGYIDLSKRRVSPEDITKCEDRYMKSKSVASIMRHVASKLPSASTPNAAAAPAPAQEHDADADEEEDTVGGVADAGTGTGEEDLEALYEQIAWPVGKKYGHPYDAFKLAIT